jgi:hypothetical protein
MGGKISAWRMGFTVLYQRTQDAMLDHLTKIPGCARKADAVPGMAHFAGSGPDDTQCRSCFFYGSMHPGAREATAVFQYRSKRCGYCLKYQQLMGERGPKIRGSNASCRYYEEGGTR